MKTPDSNKPLQLRIPRDEEPGAKLAQKIKKIASVTGLSENAVGNLAVAAGLPMIEKKMREINDGEKQAA